MLYMSAIVEPFYARYFDEDVNLCDGTNFLETINVSVDGYTYAGSYAGSWSGAISGAVTDLTNATATAGDWSITFEVGARRLTVAWSGELAPTLSVHPSDEIKQFNFTIDPFEAQFSNPNLFESRTPP